MSRIDIVRAWKDEEYRNSLSDAERALLPDNPVGQIELSDADLDGVVGGENNTLKSQVSCTNCSPCPTRQVDCRGGFRDLRRIPDDFRTRNALDLRKTLDRRGLGF